MNKTKRFYIFTGKGGVGKTTLAFSFCEYLKSQNKKVALVYFKNSKLDENPTQYNEVIETAKDFELDVRGLELLESSQKYIAMKLKSATIASWVVKTPFFKSLINMIPGFNYLIYIGQILHFLEEDPELTIVLDSPSSGHALTMLEATKNFHNIFQSGILHNDTTWMLESLTKDNFLKINIITLPTQLALNEASELDQSIKRIEKLETQIFCNNIMMNHGNDELPEFLQKKISNEKEAIAGHDIPESGLIPFSMTDSSKNVAKDLVPFMENLV